MLISLTNYSYSVIIANTYLIMEKNAVKKQDAFLVIIHFAPKSLQRLLFCLLIRGKLGGAPKRRRKRRKGEKR